MPVHYHAYHEPFLGGGALFFALRPERAYLADINGNLITTYTAVRDNVESVISRLRTHQRKHGREHYGKARTALHTETDPVRLAALFLYLNKTCFKGLYRVNKHGLFNAAMGNIKKPVTFDEENLKKCSRILKNVHIRNTGFDETEIRKGDFYYFDPPYHGTYSSYDKSGFGEAEHIRLAKLCRDIHEKGGRFMLSNSDTPFVRKLYRGFIIESVPVRRGISGVQGGKEREVIIRNYGT